MLVPVGRVLRVMLLMISQFSILKGYIADFLANLLQLLIYQSLYKQYIIVFFSFYV